MRRRMAILLALSLLMGALSAAPAAADNHGGDDEGDGGVYLALGDSVPAGFSPGIPISEDGYPNMLFDKLEKKYKLDTLVNLSCPGDDTLEMLDGNLGNGSVCYGDGAFLPPGGPSQVDAAVEYLTANPGEVELITLTIGANDLLACSPAFELACLAQAYGTIIGDPDPFDGWQVSK
ncbi:MAG: SGNH/GDSL hydrolase family protein, partial [Acidimicrobiia bacterium]|nr:SGNH/GDSL hydrolase family protein [Acidimicrobiia bacterium]